MRELFDEVSGKSPLDPEEAVRRTTRGPQRKRFYATAGVVESPEGLVITLDGKPVRTPSGRALVAPTAEIAEAISEEWNAQQEVIDPLTMPLTRFANSVVDAVVDRVGARRRRRRKIFPLRPAVLSRRPSRGAGGAGGRTVGSGAVLGGGCARRAFYSRTGDRACRSARCGRSHASAALPDDPWSIAAMHVITTLTGSALLALALLRGAIDKEQVWAAAHVDEDWNIDRWGVDEEVAARRAARRVDFEAAARILRSLNPGAG